MPWELVGNCVHKKGSDTPIPGGCHDSRAEAEAHMRALYASEPSAGKARRRWGRRFGRPLFVGGDFTTAMGVTIHRTDDFTPALTVFKQADGTYRWVLFSSTAFEDRDGEIVSQKALEADVARADGDGDFGPLRWWHITRADIGDCDFNMLYGRTLVEAGTFRDPVVAKAVAENAADLEVSIGFTHPVGEPDADGVFHNIRRFERSLLPRGVASNRFTSVSVITKESNMGNALEEKLAAFGALLKAPPDRVKAILNLADVQEKAADAAGVRHKAAKADDDKPAGEDAAADAPFPKAEAEDDEEPEESEKKTKAADAAPAVIGDMTPAEFTQFLGTALKEFSDRLAAVETATRTKAAGDAEQAKALKALDGKLGEIAEAAEAALTGVKELKGELPRVLGDKRTGTFRPSADGPEPSEKLKERIAANKEAQAGPHADDPWAKHMNAIFGAAGTPQG